MELEEVGVILLVCALTFSALGALWWIFRGPTSSDFVRRPARGPRRYDANGWTLIVDGSNLAYRENELRFTYLNSVLQALEAEFLAAEIHVYCDANLPHLLRETEGDDVEMELRRRLEGDGGRHWELTHGERADVRILERGRRPKTIVVSNDQFRDYPERTQIRQLFVTRGLLSDSFLRGGRVERISDVLQRVR